MRDVPVLPPDELKVVNGNRESASLPARDFGIVTPCCLQQLLTYSVSYLS